MKAPSKVSSPYRIHPHSHVDLKKISTSDTGHYKSEDSAKHDTQKNLLKLAALQELLAANATKGLLIVLQAMDAGGKDGTISHIFTGVNPQGCEVAQFKVPTPLEASHDFLWRVHKRVPAKGKIGIFNRSHYEDVLITRVHGNIDKKELQRRYDEINEFEKMLAENGTVILKFFLHISHKEQTARLKERMADPDKHWKLSESDFRERRFWKQYQQAYEQAIAATSKAHAPWFVVPSDYKWFRNVEISRIIVEALRAMKLSYPKPGIDFSKYQL